MKPLVRDLDLGEMNELLTRNHVGRFAFAWEDSVGIEPLHFVYEAPWLFGRTDLDDKLVALAHNTWCAVEVDEIEALFHWQSVVVRGPFSALNSPLRQDEKYDRAVAAIRTLIPEAFTPDDPTPNRNIVFAVNARHLTGKSMETPRSGPP